MRSLTTLTTLSVIAALLQACGGSSPSGSNNIGGSTNIPLNQVGNEISTGAISMAGTSYDVDGTMIVTTNQDGLITLRVTADLSNAPALLAKANAWIPSQIAGGVINTDIQMRVTENGIQDFFNKDKKQQTLVNYSAKVGDTYKVTKSDGNTITRTVTGVSTVDDFPYGFMMIKTITIEQDSRIPGVQKIIYRANHRFGLVFVEAVLEDGTRLGTYLYPQSY